MYKQLKRATAVLLAGIIAVTATLAAAISTYSAATIIDGRYYEEDFSGGSLLDWEELNGTGVYRITDSEEGNLLKFDYAASKAGTPYLLGLKDGIVPSSGIEEASFTVKFSKNPTLYGGLEIVYDYTDKDNYKFVNLGSFGTYGWFRRDNAVEDGKVTVGTTNSITTEIDFTNWVKVSVSYKDGKANIVIKQDDLSLSFSYSTSSTPLFLSNWRVNNNESAVMYYKNVSVYFSGYGEYLAEQYLTKHKTVLNKTLQDITAADKTAVEDALNDYSLLSTAYQNKYYKYVLLLNGFLEKIGGGADYDDSLYTRIANWTVLKGTPNAANFKIDSDGVISLSQNVMIRLNPSSYLEENYVAKKFTYKIKYSAENKGGTGIRYIYDYTDENNYKYNSIWYDSTHGYFNQYWACSQGSEKSTGTGYAHEIKDLSGWLDVTVDLSQSGKYIFTLSREDGTGSFKYSGSSEIDSLILYANTTCFIKDIQVYTYYEDDVSVGEKEIRLFKNNYAEILSLTPDMVSKNLKMKQDIETAIADYDNNLTGYAKECLISEYNLLKGLLAAINALSGEYTEKPEYSVDADGAKYYNWSDGFENGLGKWSKSIPAGKVISPSAAIVTDPLEASNHAVSITQHGFIYPSSYSVPERAQLSKVTFRLKLGNNIKFYVNKPLTIMLSYADASNWQALEIYGMTETDVKLSYRFSKCVDGVYSAGFHYGSRLAIFDYYNNWIDVTLNYTGGTKVAVEVKSGETTDMFSQSLTVPYGQFALWSQNNYNWLYDDVEILYKEGNWEDNVKIDEIYPYFSGNTEYNPDDVVTVYGENINNTVTRVECVRISDEEYRNALLSNVSSAQKTFLPEISYSHGRQTASFVTAASDAYWDGARAVSLKMLQPSSNSFKVILPKSDSQGNEITGGVYALKLHGTDSSGAKDVVIYINNPEIDYINGDDGDHATQGGQLRVIGENLALYYDEVDKKDFINDSEAEIKKLNSALASGKYKVFVRVANAGYEKVFSSLGGGVTIQSRNSLTVNLPSDIPLGDYEVSVYNGHGDYTCWSAPCEIKVGADVRSTWNQTVYDITNYGASASDSDQNITSILMNVIQIALEKTDGGIIYIPRGRYKLVYGIVIPEKIQLVGDGSDKTILYWEPFQWKMKSCPQFMVAFSKNISISGIGFYGTRGTCLFRSYGGSNSQNSTAYNENVYLSDVHIQFMPYLGVATGGSGVGVVVSPDAVNLIRAELSTQGAYGMFVQNPYNVNFNDVELERETPIAESSQPMAMNYGKYVHIKDSYFDNGWMHGNIYNTIIEYTEFAKGTIGFQGENVYFHGCTIYDRTMNNRELFVADGSPLSSGGSTGAIITLATPEECSLYGYEYGYAYRVISGWGEQHDRIQLYVRTGQGVGQTRMTTGYRTHNVYDSSGGQTGKVTFVTVNEPFVVAPNSNSRVVARTARENMYFDYMFYSNGCATGYFGGFADTVYDNCVWKQVTDIYFDSYNADLNWYLSIINGRFYDAYNMHDTGSSEWFTDYGSIIFTSQNSSGATSPTCCVRFANNDLDGYQLYAKSAYADGVRDIVIQGNSWDNSITAITATGGSRDSGADGIFIYKNSVGDVERFLNNTYTGNNSLGSKRLINYVVGDSNGFAVGDVNADGNITLKDATLIKYYISGEIEFSEDQIKRADFFADGSVNVKDAVAIRYFVITGERMLENGGEESSGGSITGSEDDFYDDIV